MMKRTILLLPLSLFVLSSLNGVAEGTDGEILPASTTKPADPSHWRIDFEYLDKDKAAASSARDSGKSNRILKSLEVTISGGKAVVDRIPLSGETEKYYLSGNYIYRTEASGPKMEDIVEGDREHNLLRNYPGTEVCRPRDFVGMVDAYGQSCRYYKRIVKSGTEGREDLAWELWLSAQGLPVAYRERGVLARYTRLDLPTAAVQLPQTYIDLAAHAFSSPPPAGREASVPRPKKTDTPPVGL